VIDRGDGSYVIGFVCLAQGVHALHVGMQRTPTAPVQGVGQVAVRHQRRSAADDERRRRRVRRLPAESGDRRVPTGGRCVVSVRAVHVGMRERVAPGAGANHAARSEARRRENATVAARRRWRWRWRGVVDGDTSSADSKRSIIVIVAVADSGTVGGEHKITANRTEGSTMSGLEEVWEQVLLGIGLALLAMLCVFVAVWLVRQHRDRRRRDSALDEGRSVAAATTPVGFTMNGQYELSHWFYKKKLPLCIL
jgi:hypothetical protein